MDKIQLGLAVLGSFYVASYVFSFARLLLDFVIPGIPISKFGAKQGAWAVVTGPTAGIGKEFALQLAKHGYNIVLAGRSLDKLTQVKDEINASSKVNVALHVIDFSTAKNSDYDSFKSTLDPLDIGILVNNVGVSYDHPTYFQDLSPELLDDLVTININGTLKTTALILPGMLSRKRGLIINLSSFSAIIPSPLLAVYSASKKFVATWSQALGSEVEDKGVVVEALNTYFVVSKLSKIRKPSFLIPLPKVYVRTVLSRIGLNGGAVGQPHLSNPYFGHALIQWVVDNFMTNAFWLKYNKNLHIDILKRVLRKRQREEAALKAVGSNKKEL